MSDDPPAPPTPVAPGCLDVEAMLGSHVLGTLEVEERRAVAIHLARCPTCPKALARHQRALDALGLGIALEAPGQAARDLLVAPIRSRTGS